MADQEILMGEETRTCACPQGCNYRIDDYAPDELVCGACLDNCVGASELERASDFRAYAGLIAVAGEEVQILVREIIEDDGTRACHVAFRSQSYETWSRPQRIEAC